MTPSQDKVLQYLQEARASELALVSTLRAHIAMAPSGSYRSFLERHLEETKAHARRVQGRIGGLGASRSALRLGVGLAQSVVGQAVALGKGPLDLVRGYSVEEKLLKNAKDDYAGEAHEIATYLALERVAEAVYDSETASLARSIRDEEERALAALGEEIPKLAEAMVRAELAHDATVAEDDEDDGEDGTPPAGAAPGTRSAPVPPATAEYSPSAPFPISNDLGSAAAAEDPDAVALPIPRYAALRASDLLPKLAGLSPAELDRVEEFERSHRARSTVLTRIASLRRRGASPPST